MEIQPVVNLLTALRLGVPALRALIPDVNNYSVLLMQPQGRIEASAAGVRHHDRTLAHEQFSGFLRLAHASNTDLAVTPEYSMPWDTLANAIRTGNIPTEGALWALGCESISYSELEVLKESLAPHAIMIYEPLQPDADRFLDPLAYVFRALPACDAETEAIVVLVQFKTCPMGDSGHFEINGLQRGTRIYEFGGVAGNPRLFSLICSDAFEFLDQHAQAVYDRALVLHIQLNSQPRQSQYRQYRDRLFRFGGNATELVCLNWAKDIHEECGTDAQCWNNISGSAWYLCPNKFDDTDNTLVANHRKGLYYTWCYGLRSHVLFFNYDPCIYSLTASKVVHIGVAASLSHRRGPQLTAMRTWNDQTSAWEESPGPCDAFPLFVAESGNANQEITRLANANPFDVERVLALTAGSIGHDTNWFHVRSLDSCGIELSEIVRRMTYCQDTDAGSRAFRTARLKRCARLWDILTDDANLPSSLQDFRNGFRFDWAPHQNAISMDGRRATVIYMGEDATDSDIESVGKRIAEFLQRSAPDTNAAIEAKQRLHLWYRATDGRIRLFDRARYAKFDDTRATSEFDIARAT